MNHQKLFGTSGIRGDAQTLFTNQFCQKIGRAFSAYLSKHTTSKIIAVGMDPRTSSPRIKENLVKALLPEFDVYDEGIVPTPCLSYFAKTKNFAGAVMVTGSHIQEELNGLKFFVNGEEILKSDEQEIETLYADLKTVSLPPSSLGKIISDREAPAAYRQMLVNLSAGSYDNLTIVIDAGNGTQSEIMPSVLSALKAKVITTNCNLNLPLLSRDLEVNQAYDDIISAMKNNQADVGILYDSDGDRSAFVTPDAQVIPTDVTGSLIAMHQTDPCLVTPINSSTVVEKIGKKVIRTKVGSPPVIEAMKKFNCKFGFESSGGTISGEVHYTRDAGITTIKLLNIMKQTGETLQMLADKLPKYYTIKDKIGCPGDLNDAILKKAKDKYGHYRIEDVDGLKVWFDTDSWLLFRPSGNAPEFRVFSESLDPHKSKKMIAEGLDLVKEVINHAER